MNKLTKIWLVACSAITLAVIAAAHQGGGAPRPDDYPGEYTPPLTPYPTSVPTPHPTTSASLSFNVTAQNRAARLHQAQGTPPVPDPTLAPTPWPTPTIRAQATPTLIPRPTPTPWARPTATPVPMTRQEVRATLDTYRTQVGLDTPTPVLPTTVPFEITDGISPIPFIENAFVFIRGRVDNAGIPLNRDQMDSIAMGIEEFYALDFERRCLTSRGTHPLFEQALALDNPGYNFVGSDGPYRRYSGASSFSEGRFSESRTGDYAFRYLDWYITHKDATYRVHAYINAETCEAVPYITGVWYDPSRLHPDMTGFGFTDPPCAYQPLKATEISGNRADISVRPVEMWRHRQAMEARFCEEEMD